MRRASAGPGAAGSAPTPCPGVPGGAGGARPGQGRSPHASWENVPGRLGGERGALCRHGNGMQICQLLFFPPFFLFFFFFYYYLPDIVIHIMFQLLGLAAEVREALCLPTPQLPKKPQGRRLHAGGVHPAAEPLPWASPSPETPTHPGYGQKQQPPHKKSDHIITNLTFQREAGIKPKAEKIKRQEGREEKREDIQKLGGFEEGTGEHGDSFEEGARCLHPPRPAAPRSAGVNFELRLTECQTPDSFGNESIRAGLARLSPAPLRPPPPRPLPRSPGRPEGVGAEPHPLPGAPRAAGRLGSALHRRCCFAAASPWASRSGSHFYFRLSSFMMAPQHSYS